MRGHIRKRGKNSWTLVVDAPRGDDGRRKQVWRTVKGNRRAADRELAKLLDEIQSGAWIEASKMTVAQYLRHWLEQIKPSVSGKTFERYAEIATRALIPAFGSQMLERLRPMAIQRFYTDCLSSGRKDGKGGLSARTVLHYHRLLHKALADAVRWQILARNPADAVSPPRVERHERPTLELEEIRRLLTVARGTRYYIPILLAVGCGLRCGEIFALEWEDIDLEARLVRVRRSAEQTGDRVVFKTPKSGRPRTIRISASVAGELRGYQLEQSRVRGLVCCREDGQPLHPDSFSGDWRKIRDRARVSHITFHDLRHTYATLQLLAGTHPKVLSELLGHSTISITQDLYSHVTAPMQDGAADRMETLLGPLLRRA
jgi:integrase